MDAPDRPFTSRTSHMIVYQNFEWDFREAAENFDTYGVAFREAATVFTAEDVAITEDVGSDRLFARGSSWRGRVLVVQHTRGVRIRILRAMLQQQAKVADEVGVATEQGTEDETEAEAKEVVQTEAVGMVSTGNVVAQVIADEADATETRVTEEDADEATPVIGITADTTEPLAAVARDDIEDVVEVAEDEDTGTTENADPGVSSIADPDASLVDAPGTTEIEELPPIGGNTGAVSTVTDIGDAADGPVVDEIEAREIRDLEPVTLPAVAETHTAHAFEPGDAIVATIDQVVEATRPRRRIVPYRPRTEDTSAQVPGSGDVILKPKEIPTAEPAARPRRPIVPHRVRTNDSTPPAPESGNITRTANGDVIKPVDEILKAKEISAPDAALPARRRGRPPRVPRDQAAAPLPAIVDRNQVVKAVAEPAPEPEETPTPERVTEPLRRRGRPRAEAPTDTTQLVLAFTKPEGNKPEAVASGAPSGSRIPGADMTADEYGIYWDAYVAARDEAKRQGKSLREAQRIGREAGDKAVARGVPAPKAAKPSPKVTKAAVPATAKALEPTSTKRATAKTTEPVAPKAPEPAQKHQPATTMEPAKTARPAVPAPKPAVPSAAKAPKPAAPKPSRKRAISWRAAARALK